jgi:hypothetical protein
VRVGAVVLRTLRKEDESVQPWFVEQSSEEGDATGTTTLRAPNSSGDIVSTAEEVVDRCEGIGQQGHSVEQRD